MYKDLLKETKRKIKSEFCALSNVKLYLFTDRTRKNVNASRCEITFACTKYFNVIAVMQNLWNHLVEKLLEQNILKKIFLRDVFNIRAMF